METTSTTKSFKEVHVELENEALFLKEKHDVSNFKTKAEFLKGIGFSNSIATKLYAAIVNDGWRVGSYQQRYGGVYKFILKPQLERICEKYNLYVRPTEFFLGDIPEKNIKEIMDFKIHIHDLDIEPTGLNRLRLQMPSPMIKISAAYSSNDFIPTSDFKRYGLHNFISIAAVKSLFHQKAFERSEERIVGEVELSAKHQVDLDPIVLFRTKDGYIIITAWGDEANDELVFNQQKN